jgi:hypothetical protein
LGVAAIISTLAAALCAMAPAGAVPTSGQVDWSFGPFRVSTVIPHGFSNDSRNQYVLVADGCSGRSIAPGSSWQILVS